MTRLSSTTRRDAGRQTRLAAGFALLSGIGATIATGLTLGNEPNQVFLATGLWALAMGLIPVAMIRDYPLFSPWSFALLTIVIGVTLRGACLSFGFPNPERLDQLYFLGREPHFFFGPAVWLLIGLAMLTSGFLVRLPKGKPGSFLAHRLSLDPRRLMALCLVLLLVSALATFLYIQRTGGFSSGFWSAKRTTIPDLDLAGTNYQSHGGLRWMASLSLYGHLLALAAALSPGSSLHRRSRLLFLGLAIGLLGLACLVPFYASLRTTVAMSLLVSTALVYFSGHRLRLPILGAGALLALVGVTVMTALRPSGPELSDTGGAIAPVSKVLEAAVINRNQIELPKTAHILAALDDGDLDRAHGRTIARWILAPIPRSLWSGKPIIPPGPEIGRTVYGQRVAGVPPSLVAELAWNFAFPGVIIGAFFLGMGLRWIDSQFLSRNTTTGDGGGVSLVTLSLYVAGPMTLAFEAVGGSLGSGLFRAGLQTAIMALLLRVVVTPAPRTQATPTRS